MDALLDMAKFAVARLAWHLLRSYSFVVVKSLHKNAAWVSEGAVSEDLSEVDSSFQYLTVHLFLWAPSLIREGASAFICTSSSIDSERLLILLEVTARIDLVGSKDLPYPRFVIAAMWRTVYAEARFMHFNTGFVA